MLGPFFNPRGVAIVGASSDPRKLGYGVVRNLLEYRYGGKIYPVNQTAKEILGPMARGCAARRPGSRR